MRDPHVERLFFEIGSGEGTEFKDPEPLTFSNRLGDFDAREGRLTVVPADHFSNEATARQVVEAFLRAWETQSDLDVGLGTIRFRFVSADIIDRDPNLDAPGHVTLLCVGTLVLSGSLTSLVSRHHNPEPPTSFESTVDVQRAHERWRNYRSGREPLQSMTYFVLTVVERLGGGRTRAARLLNIHPAVLNTFGRLASSKGDATTARKSPSNGAFQPLTPTEKAWLEETTRRLIRRLGEHAAGATLTRLTMGQLPKL
jgi:hypothetical protein